MAAKNGFMKPVKPDSKLAKIVGSTPMPRTQIVKKTWEYIRRKKIQDGRNILAGNDADFKAFAGCNELDMFKLAALISKHVS